MTDLIAVPHCGALEPWRGSPYSPRPPESGLKKSPNLIPDQKANLPRLWTVTSPPQKKPNGLLIDCFRTAERAFIGFLKALVQRLPKRQR